MTKAEFITSVEGKPGFIKILSDVLAPDSPGIDGIQKYILTVLAANGDGTEYITHVVYILDTVTGQAKFYNTELPSFSRDYISPDEQKVTMLKGYLLGKYEAFFLGRVNAELNWAEADVFTLDAGKLVKKSVLVYKKGSNPISDIDVI